MLDRCHWIHFDDLSVLDYNAITVAAVKPDGSHYVQWRGYRHEAKAASPAQAVRWIEAWVANRDSFPGNVRRRDWGL